MPQKWREILFPQTKNYKLERPHFISLYGVKKFWEVSPIVGIVSFVFGTAGLMHTSYYPWTRTDVAYTRVPGYRSIGLDKPKHCKLWDFKDYSTYKPNVDLIKLSTDMACTEWKRFCNCIKAHINIENYIERLLRYPEDSC